MMMMRWWEDEKTSSRFPTLNVFRTWLGIQIVMWPRLINCVQFAIILNWNHSSIDWKKSTINNKKITHAHGIHPSPRRVLPSLIFLKAIRFALCPSLRADINCFFLPSSMGGMAPLVAPAPSSSSTFCVQFPSSPVAASLHLSSSEEPRQQQRRKCDGDNRHFFHLLHLWWSMLINVLIVLFTVRPFAYFTLIACLMYVKFIWQILVYMPTIPADTHLYEH